MSWLLQDKMKKYYIHFDEKVQKVSNQKSRIALWVPDGGNWSLPKDERDRFPVVSTVFGDCGK